MVQWHLLFYSACTATLVAFSLQVYTLTYSVRASRVVCACIIAGAEGPNPVVAVTYNNIACCLKRMGKLRTALQVPLAAWPQLPVVSAVREMP
jgi:hypothetical protein